MTTRLQLRAQLRMLLEDTALTPLWSDSQLNDALWTGLIRLSSRLPSEARLSLAIPGNVLSVPAGFDLPRNRILGVINDRGDPVPEGLTAGRDDQLTWRWWASSLVLSRELGAGATWSIEYKAVRTMPTDDVTTVSIATEDEPILIAFAMEVILRTRAVEEMKRNGNSRPAQMLAEAAMADAERLIRARRRIAQSRLAIRL
jgi:hypothetical protein